MGVQHGGSSSPDSAIHPARPFTYQTHTRKVLVRSTFRALRERSSYLPAYLRSPGYHRSFKLTA